MIQAVEIKNLRGIAEGKLEGLGRLAVLVGPNGSGKSTILDALLIGAGAKPASAVGFVVRRRAGLNYGARWLFHRGGFAGPAKAEISVDLGGPKLQSTAITFIDGAPGGELRRRLVERQAPGLYRTVEIRRETAGGSRPDAAIFAKDNSFAATDEEDTAAPVVWLVDPNPSIGPGLHKLFSRISERGRRLAVRDLLRPLVPDLDVLELAVDEDDGRLNLAFSDRSIPVALAGEAVHALVRVALEVAGSPAETLLFEEPEIHAHPAAMRQIARALVEGVRSGKQVILTTHSLELIDAILDALTGSDIDLLTLHGVRLDGGTLKVGRMQGEAVLRSRGEIGEDLR